MLTIALFHSVLGVRPGVADAAERLRAMGHEVLVVDQYGGRVFDDYDEASAFSESIGFPALMSGAVAAVAGLPDAFVVMGFSNGGGMATWVALNRSVRGAVLVSGALPLERIGAADWPAGVPAQLHYTVADPKKVPGSVESVLDSVTRAGAVAEYVQYPEGAHLFTDASLPDEFSAASTEAFWRHVERFLRGIDD